MEKCEECVKKDWEITVLQEKLLGWQHETQQLKEACRKILKMDEPRR